MKQDSTESRGASSRPRGQARSLREPSRLLKEQENPIRIAKLPLHRTEAGIVGAFQPGPGPADLISGISLLSTPVPILL